MSKFGQTQEASMKIIGLFIIVSFLATDAHTVVPERHPENVRKYQKNPRNPSFPESFGRVQSGEENGEIQREEEMLETQEALDHGNGSTTNRAMKKMQETRE